VKQGDRERGETGRWREGLSREMERGVKQGDREKGETGIWGEGIVNWRDEEADERSDVMQGSW
jgi:hypothetical protein